jgi:hypothetical protein
VNTVQVDSNLLIFSSIVIHVFWQVVCSGVWIERELMVHLERDWHVACEAQIFCGLLSRTNQTFEWAITSLRWKTISSRIVFSKWTIRAKDTILQAMLVMVWDSIALHKSNGVVGPPLGTTLHLWPRITVARIIQN